MANSSTALNDVPAGYSQADSITEVRRVIIDTVDTALTVLTPATGKYWAITGLQYAAAAAHNLTIRSGAQDLLQYELAANTGIFHPVDSGIMLFGNAADDILEIESSAAIGSMIFYIQEFTTLPLGEEFDRQ
jgi:hypothetical protein